VANRGGGKGRNRPIQRSVGRMERGCDGSMSFLRMGKTDLAIPWQHTI
jgi:hypothetical protein